MRGTAGIVALVWLAACGGKSKPASTGHGSASGSGSGTASPLLMQTLVNFGTESSAATPPHTKIWLVVTDETGAAKSFPLDEIDAPCTQTPGGEMDALSTLHCLVGGKGANYIAVGRGSDIILLKQAVDPSDDEPSDYEETMRIPVPVGSKLAYQP